MSGLIIENINKSFGDNHVLKDVSLDIAEGEFVSVLGPSGCGKTTLLKLIAGLEIPQSGSVFIGGVCCNNVPAKKRGAVIVFQDYGLFPHMTVKQNIEFGLVAKKMSRADREAKIKYVVDVMQIDDKISCYPGELSGGQKQRVALARACALEPCVLLLDEPFSNLDTALRDSMREFVSSLQKEMGITTILVTHDKEEAFMLSKRVAVILDGRLHQFDAPETIYAMPLSMQVANFIGEANYICGDIQDGAFSCCLGEFGASNVTGCDARLMLRHDQVILDSSGGVPCRVLEKKYRGHTTTYRVTLLKETGVEMRINSPNNSFEPGAEVFVRVHDGAGCVLVNEK